MTDCTITDIADARLARDTDATIRAAIACGRAATHLSEDDIDDVVGEANAQLSAYGMRLEAVRSGG